MEKTVSTKFSTVNEYFASLSPAGKKVLKELRGIIKEAAPGAEETISYNIPAFKLGGLLVWYAAFKDHVSLFPKSNAIAAFKKDLARFGVSKGTIQFPLDKPLPSAVIKKIVKFRVKENLAKV